ncbi:MAG: helix-turn-helix domain-containing protein [Ilumatobacteraceae bacterium]
MSRHFDRRAFGGALRARRELLGYSTRDVADRAHVSQSYVVALEGSRSSRDSQGSSPTVDVVLRLAAALLLDPVLLVAGAVRTSGPHVLVVAEDDGASLLDALVASVGDVDAWVTAGQRADLRGRHEHVTLHADDAQIYDPQAVALAVEQELLGFVSTIEGQRLAMVFSESASMLTEATASILDAEHSWSHMVSNAVWSAGAHPAWNFCVYELDTIKRMADPLTASLELIRTHDEVWTARNSTLVKKGSGRLRLLQHLRPPGTPTHHWREICDKQLARLSAN